MITPWGYEITGDLPSIITVDQFDMLTGGRMGSTTEQKKAKLEGVSAAIRDWCGWHVAPNLDCTFIGDGDGRLLVLPALAVTAVSSVEVEGIAVGFEWRREGLVRLTHGLFPDKWRSVSCAYSAGFDASSTLGEIVAQIAANAIVAAPGIAEEHAGGVGATYNKTGDGITGGVSLLPRDKELLAPYRIVGTW